VGVVEEWIATFIFGGGWPNANPNAARSSSRQHHATPMPTHCFASAL